MHRLGGIRRPIPCFSFPLQDISVRWCSQDCSVISRTPAAVVPGRKLFQKVECPTPGAAAASASPCRTVGCIRVALGALQRRQRGSGSCSEAEPVLIASLQAGLPAIVRTTLRSEVFGGLVATLKRHPEIFDVNVDNGTVALTKAALADRTNPLEGDASTTKPANLAAADSSNPLTSAGGKGGQQQHSEFFDILDSQKGAMNPFLDETAFERLQRRSREVTNIRKSEKPIIAVPLYGKGNTLLATINIAEPPLTASEAQRLDVPRYLSIAKITWRRNPSPIDPEEVVRLLVKGGEQPPQHSRAIDDFDELDQEYSEREYLTPSFVANIMVRYVPTFFVEVRNVVRGVPPAVMDLLMTGLRREGWNQSPILFFARYPMLFQVKNSKYERPAVRLSGVHGGFTRHPQFGYADAHLRQLSVEKRISITGMLNRRHTTRDTTKFGVDGEQDAAPQEANSAARTAPVPKSMDITIFQILLKNLPLSNENRPRNVREDHKDLSSDDRRRPGWGEKNPADHRAAAQDEEYLWRPLVPWINSFSSEDLETLNRVPEQRVLTILFRYSRVFQVSSINGADENLYYDAAMAKGEFGRDSATNINRSSGMEAAEDLNDNNDGDDDDDDASRSPLAPSAVPSADGGPEDTESRVKKFQTALQEDLVSLDEILSPLLTGADDTGSNGELVFDRGETAVEYSEAELAGEDTPAQRQHTDTSESWNTAKKEDMIGEERGVGCADEYVPSKFDALLVRLLPPSLAPRCLNCLCEATTPHPGLLAAVLGMLALPRKFMDATQHLPTAARTPPQKLVFEAKMPQAPHSLGQYHMQQKLVETVWRWRSIDEIYRNLSAEHKSVLKSFRGLANFLRMHGKLFEVSLDKRFVIRIDPKGELIPPFIPTQKFFTYEDRIVLKSSSNAATRGTLIGDDLRDLYDNVLQGAQFPTTRNQLLLLDPQNPILDAVVLCNEIAQFLPDHPVKLQSLGIRLPPLLKAALPTHYLRILGNSAFLELEKVGNGNYTIQKRRVNPDGAGEQQVKPAQMALEAVLAEVRSLVPPGGILLGSLTREMSVAAKTVAIKRNGTVRAFLQVNPQLFRLEEAEMQGRSGEMRTTFMVFNAR
jgi:hypothetical protein